MNEDAKVIYEIKNLKQHFRVKRSFNPDKNVYVLANDGVSIAIKEGETFGLVGESGCGKSTLGRTMIKLYEPSAGKIYFDGIDITHYNHRQMHKYRKDIQIIFQDPYSSLSPRMTVGNIIAEGLIEHGLFKKGSDELEEYVKQTMIKCGLADYMIYRYPSQFSGGQRQRISIARALALNPRFIVCDEAVSALDVSIQSQILNLLMDLRDEHNLTYLFISHDLSVVKHISDRIGVMYLGKLVEVATSDALYEKPLHPYTDALIQAIPLPVVDKSKKKVAIEGDIPSNRSDNCPSGCKFYSRCPLKTDLCSEVEPALEEKLPGRFVACHHAKI